MFVADEVMECTSVSFVTSERQVFLGYVYHMTTAVSLEGHLKCDNQSTSQSRINSRVFWSVCECVYIFCYDE